METRSRRPDIHLSPRCFRREVLMRLGLLVLVVAAAGSAVAGTAAALAADDALDARVHVFLDKHRGAWHEWNVPEADGRILHDLVLEHRFRRALEIGTSTGHSGVWIAWALARTGGRLTTIEIDPGRHETALRNFEVGRRRHAHRRAARRRARARAAAARAVRLRLLRRRQGLVPAVLQGPRAEDRRRAAASPRTTCCAAAAGARRAFLEYVKKLPGYETTVETGGGEGISISCKRR